MIEMEAASLNDVAAQYGSVVGRMAVLTHSNLNVRMSEPRLASCVLSCVLGLDIRGYCMALDALPNCRMMGPRAFHRCAAPRKPNPSNEDRNQCECD